MVRPGGLNLDEPVGARPTVLDITPQPARPGGRIRIDVAAAAAVDGVWVGGKHLVPGDPALTLARSVSSPTAIALVDLSRSGLGALGAGAHRVTVAAAGLASRTVTAHLTDEGVLLDAPAQPAHDPSTDLGLSGAQIDSVNEIVAWPHAGTGSPAEVHRLPFTHGGPNALTVHSAGGLADLPTAITWRVAARLAGQSYTPHVMLGLAR